ncbi:MAG: DUF1573 domain-containing protein [Planctomycetaceae bacterium]
MRITSILVGLVCLIAALSFTVWIGGDATNVTKRPFDPDASSSPRPEGVNAAKDEANGRDDPAHVHGKPAADANSGDRSEEPNPEVSPTGPYPKVHVENASYNFGAMEPETFGQRVFTIRNDGTVPLSLRRGTSTCQCTLFDILKSEVPPGETADILVKWRPKASDRHFEQSLHVKTNDPKQRVVKLTVNGLVEPKIVLMPHNPWNVGTYTGKGDSNPFYGSITSRMVADFQIESVEAEHSELVTVNITPLAETDDLIAKEKYLSGVKVEIILHPDVPVGTINEAIKLRTNVPGFETLALGITGQRTGPIRIYPTQGVRFDPDRMLISMGQFPSQDGKKVELRMLVSEMEGDFEISDIEAEPSTMKMTIQKDTTSFADPTRQRYLLTFEVPPGGSSHARTLENIAKIKFRTNHPQTKEMTFYFEYIAL